MKSIEDIKKLEGIINSKLKDCKIKVKIIESKDKYDGKIIILKDEKVIRVFAIGMVSSCQINISENDKIIELGLFIDNLGAWLFNLYNKIEYIYVFYGGKLNRQVFTRETISKISKEMTSDRSKEREKGEIVPRKELDEQPKVEGYLGPMFEEIDYGKIYLRYETQEIYNMLSA